MIEEKQGVLATGIQPIDSGDCAVDSREVMGVSKEHTLLIPPGNMTAPRNEAPLRYVQYLVPSIAMKEYLNNYLNY
jgi:hypothetical protein